MVGDRGWRGTHACVGCTDTKVPTQHTHTHAPHQPRPPPYPSLSPLPTHAQPPLISTRNTRSCPHAHTHTHSCIMHTTTLAVTPELTLAALGCCIGVFVKGMRAMHVAPSISHPYGCNRLLMTHINSPAPTLTALGWVHESGSADMLLPQKAEYTCTPASKCAHNRLSGCQRPHGTRGRTRSQEQHASRMPGNQIHVAKSIKLTCSKDYHNKAECRTETLTALHE